VLAGGRSRRFGADKLAADLRGRPLLDSALEAALDSAERVVVVGPDERTWPDRVVVVREEPAYSGPFAAVVAGAAALASHDCDPATPVLVLAGDLVDPGPLVHALLAALAADTSLDAAVAVDAEGHRQPLLAAYRLAALQTAGGRGDPTDQPARSLLSNLTVREIPDPANATRDVDTPADLARETRRLTPGP
jgi:molybdopterin-guanine dinucleotide biosynthesis protein A